MTIETKYNIGDEVWVMREEPTLSRVAKVIASCSSRGNHCWYKLEDKSYFPEYDLFPTKEELLKSL